MTTLIEAKKVSAGYGHVPVIHDIDLHVNQGEVVAILGANGAGKTTTVLGLTGELPLSGGEVVLEGTQTRAPLSKRARNGVAYVMEGRSVFNGMSAADNLVVAGVDQGQVLELFPELEKRLRVPAGLLSGGEQQMLTLGRALARDPKLLLADELSLGLAPLVVTRLLKAVRDAADSRGTGALIIEQHARKALHYSDRVYVMQRGRIVASATAREAEDNIADLEAAYLTSSAD